METFIYVFFSFSLVFGIGTNLMQIKLGFSDSYVNATLNRKWWSWLRSTVYVWFATLVWCFLHRLWSWTILDGCSNLPVSLLDRR